MLLQVDHTIVFQRYQRTIVVARNAPSDRVRALMVMGCCEDTAAVFVFGNAHRDAVVQLARRKGLTQ